MNSQEIRLLQERVGALPDGKWGPKSIAACRAHLRALMPAICPWPSPDDVSMTRFYGKAGDESNLVNLPVDGIGILYDGKPVRTIRVHEKCAESLHRILIEISCGQAAWVLKEYAGCFNPRPMRGGARPSKHAWGAAIDLAPDTNMLKSSWPTQGNMPIQVMEAFSREGWASAGAFWEGGKDAMHAEATKV